MGVKEKMKWEGQRARQEILKDSCPTCGQSNFLQAVWHLSCHTSVSVVSRIRPGLISVLSRVELGKPDQFLELGNSFAKLYYRHFKLRSLDWIWSIPNLFLVTVQLNVSNFAPFFWLCHSLESSDFLRNSSIPIHLSVQKSMIYMSMSPLGHELPISRSWVRRTIHCATQTTVLSRWWSIWQFEKFICITLSELCRWIQAVLLNGVSSWLFF